MKREIKFRAWDVERKEFVDFTKYQDFAFANSSIEKNVLFITAGLSRNPDHFILEQFTGLKDKNGVEIYESDYSAIRKSGCNLIRPIQADSIVEEFAQALADTQQETERKTAEGILEEIMERYQIAKVECRAVGYAEIEEAIKDKYLNQARKGIK